MIESHYDHVWLWYEIHESWFSAKRISTFFDYFFLIKKFRVREWCPTPRKGKPQGLESTDKGTYIYLTPKRLIRVRICDLSNAKSYLAPLSQSLGGFDRVFGQSIIVLCETIQAGLIERIKKSKISVLLPKEKAKDQFQNKFFILNFFF